MRLRAIAFGFVVGLAVGPGAMVMASSASALTAKVPFCSPERNVCARLGRRPYATVNPLSVR